MNYSPTILKKSWYQTLNHSKVPCVGESFNQLPKIKQHFDAFSHSLDSIGNILKFGVSKGYITNERISDLINIDTYSHKGMSILAEIMANDFWSGFSNEVNTMSEAIEKRYLSNMPTSLREPFIAQAKRCLGYHDLSIGQNSNAHYSPERIHITIGVSEPYLTNFNFAKYQFDSRVKDALFTLINHTLSHQLECPAAMTDGTCWMIEELLDGREQLIQDVYLYWKEHNEDYDLDVEEMAEALDSIDLYGELLDIGISGIVEHVEAEKIEKLICQSLEDKELKKCLSVLASSGQDDEHLMYLVKMAKSLPTTRLHHATENIGDVPMECSAIYSFNSTTEFSMAESTINHTYQTGEEPAIELEPSELGLSFLNNYFESLYLKSLILVILE